MEITKFHVICFCVTITVGINSEDVQSLHLLTKFLGDEISNNSCLIITHCESKNEEQRNKMKSELDEDVFFKTIAPFFKLGVFFLGSLNRDDYNLGNESVIKQYVTISEYRTKLIELFISDIKPFPISETLISEIRRANELAAKKEIQLEDLGRKYAQQERLVEELRAKCEQQERLINDSQAKCTQQESLIKDLQAKYAEQQHPTNDLRAKLTQQEKLTKELQGKLTQQEKLTKELQAKLTQQEKLTKEL
jgi:hypothetical protein